MNISKNNSCSLGKTRQANTDEWKKKEKRMIGKKKENSIWTGFEALLHIILNIVHTNRYIFIQMDQNMFFSYFLL